MTVYIEDPIEYLKSLHPGRDYVKASGCSIPEGQIAPYIIEDYNSCVVNAAASLLEYHLKPAGGFSETFSACRGVAFHNYVNKRRNRRFSASVKRDDFLVPLGKTASFLNKCAASLGSGRHAKSSLRVRSVAKAEIAEGRPVFLNIAFSKQYYNHTVLATGWEEYAPAEGRGRSYLFFRIFDGYVKKPRYLVMRRIFGIFVTSLN